MQGTTTCNEQEQTMSSIIQQIAIGDEKQWATREQQMAKSRKRQ
jgi:hypothetical protein